MSITEPTTLAERVTLMQQGLAAHLPADIVEVFTADQQRMRAAGISPDAARPGTPMPDADLLDPHGEPTTLTGLRAGRPAVVVFYRGAWCPYCNLTLKAYQERLAPELAAQDIALIAVSPQKPDGSLTSAELNALSFDVVSDPGNRIAAALQIVTAPSQDARAATQRLGIDLRDANADGGYGLPMPTVVVVAADGVITWSDVHPDYTTRTEVPDILAAVADLPPG
jgi:peroxiredoxin